MTDEELLDALVRRLRPTVKPGADALVEMARTMNAQAGAMALREQQGEAREQRILDALAELRLELARTAPREIAPRTEAARDRADEERLTLAASIYRGIRLAPTRTVTGLQGALAYVQANPKKAVLLGAGATTMARVLAGWIPGLAPIADIMEALMKRISPGAEASP